jgi:hypothetical protein
MAKGEVVVLNTHKDAPLAGHAEGKALNSATLDEEARLEAAGTRRILTKADRSMFELENVWIDEKGDIEIAPRCGHYQALTDGVTLTEAQAAAEKKAAAAAAAKKSRSK